MSRPIFILTALEELIDSVVALLDADSEADIDNRTPEKQAAVNRVHEALEAVREGRQ